VDPRELIESGQLELFVLGQLSSEERKEVETMAQKYPELRLEINRIEASIKAISIQGEKFPRPELRERIASQLNFIEEKKSIEKPQGVQGRLIPLNIYIWSLAACFALLLWTSISLLKVYKELEITKEKYLTSIQETKKYASQTSYLKNEFDRLHLAVTDTNNISLKLKGTLHYPNAIAVLYWNRIHHSVSLIPRSLPISDASHSYQLWAIVDGKPLSEGVFEVKGDSIRLEPMKDRLTAQAFAITLEPKGGSPNPHLENMVVMVKI